MDNLVSIFENADPFKSWWPVILALAAGLIITVRSIMSGQRCPNDNCILKQLVIVTGGSSGVGLEIAKALAARGGRVIIASKDTQAAERAVKLIKRELNRRTNDNGKINGSNSGRSSGSTSNTNSHVTEATDSCKYWVQARHLDLRSFESVRHFAQTIMNDFEHIDILVNNAGVIFQPMGVPTDDGYEVHLQVNYLSHFLLVQLLLPHLRKSLNGRIINVSAHAHIAAKIDFDDPLNLGPWALKFHARDAFAHSKLAIVLATKWLAKELEGSSVTVNCCTPGLVRGTGHMKNSPLMSVFFVKIMTFPWMWLFMKNSYEGAQCAIRLATDPLLKQVSGEYFNDCEKAEPSETAKDMRLAKKLYNETLRVVEKFIETETAKSLENKTKK